MCSKAREALSYNEVDNIFGALGDGVILTDAQGNITYMNKAAEDIFQYTFTKDETVSFGTVCTLVNVETKEKFYSPVAKAIRTKGTVGINRNIGIIREEGPLLLSATCSPQLDDKGEVIGTTCIFRDITQMRSVESKVESDQFYMRSVFEAAKIGICSLDVRGEIMEVNEAALETLGATYNDSIGMQLGDVFKCVNCTPYGCGRSEKCKFCIIRNNIEAAVLDDGFSTEFVAAVISSATEEPIWLQFFLTQVWKDNEKQVVLTMIDISKRKQKEKELTEARRLAEVASTTKTQFLANMSHEIRTPINGMTGMINLTLRTSLTDEQRENLQAAKQCSEDLLRIINDILDYAKLENGKMLIEKIDLDLHVLINRISSLHSQVAEGKELTFVAPDCSQLPQFIKGDPLRIRQVLHNLLTNALKFTMEGSVTLGARTYKRGTKDMLEFFVEDTGIGMSIEEQGKLFKPFSQVDGSTTRRFGGTGLGLMIVKELVTAMDGEIRVVSKPNVGSRFSFSIPLILAEKADTELKDQAVFLNPYRPGQKAAPSKPELPEGEAALSPPKLDSAAEPDGEGSEEPQAPALDLPDDDILELLKYCEEKLND